jgi:molybdopterin-containing oxidoreductase family membrane subunit
MSASLQEPVVAPGYDSELVTQKITGVVLARPLKRGWLAGFGFAFLLLMLLNFAIGWLLLRGVGVWGVNVPVAWGFAIVNFVWWIGIGHAGTFISAILLLLHQDWRTSINRFAEAMTLFAVACAGLFPLLHLGRPWVFYWLLPYPDTMDLWPQWRSPLVWDVFAVSTYLTVSLIFWYVGLIPDLATMRDRAQRRPVQFIYGIIALGWRGSARHWKRFQMAYLLLAGLATPLVLSVHSVVSLDFAVAIVPGWHSTIFPPYFVAGAIFSGFAMVLTLVIPVRKAYGLQDFITFRHLENCAKIMLATGLMVAHGYSIEAFMSWYSDDKFDIYMTLNRMFGPYWPAWWLLILCNVVVPQALWFKRIRTNPAILFVIALLVNVGMWTERYVIVVTSLHRDFMPSAWGMFYGTRWDWMTLIGSFGLFLSLLFLFFRLLPAISISEMRKLVSEKKKGTK